MMRFILSSGFPFPYPENLTPEAQDAISEEAHCVELELAGVVHFEWRYALTIQFTDLEAMRAAQELTGWEVYERGQFILAAFTDESEGYGHPAIIAGDKSYCGFILKGDENAK